jgi:RND family efflux transporter MFP subunit
MNAPRSRRLPSDWLRILAWSTAALAAACGGQREYVEPPPPRVTVAQPQQRSVTDYLEMTGTTEAIETVEIRARVEGFLLSREFEEADVVRQGDLLYVIDPAEYEARVEGAEAALKVAVASLDLEEARLERLVEARRSRAVSELEVIQSQAQRDVSAAHVEAARAELRRAKLDLGYTRIRAPITGRVGRSLVDEDNLVGAGEKTLLTSIVRYDPIYAYFDINERALLALIDSTEEAREKEGRLEAMRQIPVELGRANEQGYPFRGNLHYTASTLDADTGTFLLRAIFRNPEPLRLLPGLFVRGRLPVREREGALLVSERALGSDQSGRYVLVVDEENVAQYRPVEVGAKVDGMRVIEKGLEAADWVITQGLLRARPGAVVEPERVTEAGAAGSSGEKAPAMAESTAGG